MVPNRSRIDTYWMEVVMFLKANYRFVPAYKDIPLPDNLGRYAQVSPRAVQRKGRALQATEAAVDPLVNGAPTT